MSRWAAGLVNGLTLLFAVLTVIVGIGTLAVASDMMDSPLFKPGSDAPPPTVAALVSPTPAAVAQGEPALVPTRTPAPSSTPIAPDTPVSTLSTLSTGGSPTITLAPVIPPTATRTPLPTRGVSQPSLTPTATLTWTPSPSASPLPLGPSATPTPALPFIIQPGTPLLRSNFANADGCDWEGIAGQIVDTLGDPVIVVQVIVSGDNIEDMLTVSGSHTYYGSSGWEVTLGTEPDNRRFLVVLLAEDGTLLSPVVEIVFTAACEQNLALINFVQIRPF